MNQVEAQQALNKAMLDHQMKHDAARQVAKLRAEALEAALRLNSHEGDVSVLLDQASQIEEYLAVGETPHAAPLPSGSGRTSPTRC